MRSISLKEFNTTIHQVELNKSDNKILLEDLFQCKLYFKDYHIIGLVHCKYYKEEIGTNEIKSYLKDVVLPYFSERVEKSVILDLIAEM